MAEFQFDPVRHLRIVRHPTAGTPTWSLVGRRDATFLSGYCSYLDQAPKFIIFAELSAEANEPIAMPDVLARGVALARSFLSIGGVARDFDAIALLASVMHTRNLARYPW